MLTREHAHDTPMPSVKKSPHGSQSLPITPEELTSRHANTILTTESADKNRNGTPTKTFTVRR
jgi:hypothetical protein